MNREASRTDLWEPGGEIPLGYPTLQSQFLLLKTTAITEKLDGKVLIINKLWKF